jgi:glutamate carboxypeptidase
LKPAKRLLEIVPVCAELVMTMFPTLAETELLSGIKAWLEIESPSRDAASVNRMMDAVVETVTNEDMGIERIQGTDGLGDCLIVRAGAAIDKPGILLMSHLDTVHPIGTIQRGLPIRREGDRLYGPGVIDMKAGAYAAFSAFRAVAASARARLPLTYLFTSDEELGSPTSRRLIERLGRKASCALVTEPARANGRVVTSRKGVGAFEIQIEGRASHAGVHHAAGRSAIREAALQIVSIEDLTNYSMGITTSVGTISGGTARNVVPQHCKFEVDLRVENAADGNYISNRLHELKPYASDIVLRVSGGITRPPFERTQAVADLYERAKSLAADIDQQLEEAPRTGGGSDGNFLAALGIATLDGLGPEGDGAHTLNEYCLISSIEPRAKLFSHLLVNLP